MFSLKAESRNIKICLAIFLSIFLILCIFASLYYGDKLLMGNFTDFNNDDVKYLRSAQTLIQTGNLTYNYPDQPTVFIMPGIVLVLAPFVKAFGMEGAVMPFRIFSALLQTFSFFVLFLVGRKIFNSKAALLCVFLSIFYMANIYVTTMALTETIVFSLLILLIYFIICATERSSSRLFIIAGVIWGISVLFRPTLAAFPLIMLIYWLFKKVKFKDMLKYSLCALIPFVILLSPWVIRNAITFNRFIPLTLSSGNPALQGTIIDYKPGGLEEIMALTDTPDVPYEKNEMYIDTAENGLAKASFEYQIKTNTMNYIKWYTLDKTFKNFEFPHMWYPIFTGSFNLHFKYHNLILLLAGIGLIFIIIRRRVSANVGLLIILVVFFNCVHLPYYCFPRYVYPVMPIVTLIAAGGIMCTYEFIKQKVKRWRT